MKRFPIGFFDIGGMDFESVFRKKKEFVDFTLNEMQKPKGLFKEWKSFCKNKIVPAIEK